MAISHRQETWPKAIVLGEKAGLDPSTLVEVLADSAATSRMLEVRGPSILPPPAPTRRLLMKVDVFPAKDPEIIANFCQAIQMSGAFVLLIPKKVFPFYTAVAAQGMGPQDTAAVVSVLRFLAGME